MLLTTPQELRLYLPSHVVESIEPFSGFIDNSEHDFLLEKIGMPLYRRLTEMYDEITDKDSILPGRSELSPWHKLIHLCQRPVAFDMLYRAVDVSAVSINASGINQVGTGGFDVADADAIERYKRRLNTEAHRGIDRLLATLEEWAEDVVAYNEGLKNPLPEEEQAFDDAEFAEEKEEIIGLWRKSRYYYFVDGLFINTAQDFNRYVDIYDSREKFIQLLPDLRYCQEFVLRPELGDTLTDYLLERMRNRDGNETEKTAINLAKYTLALKVEARSSMFKRETAKDEAIGSMTRLVEHLKSHQDQLPEEVVKTSPFYVRPAEPKTPDGEGSSLQPSPTRPWANNRKGNKLFVIPAIE